MKGLQNYCFETILLTCSLQTENPPILLLSVSPVSLLSSHAHCPKTTTLSDPVLTIDSIHECCLTATSRTKVM